MYMPPLRMDVVCQIVCRTLAADESHGSCPLPDSKLKYFIRGKTWFGPKDPNIPYTIIFTYDRIPSSESGVDVSSYSFISTMDTAHVPISITNEKGMHSCALIIMLLSTNTHLYDSNSASIARMRQWGT